MKSFKTFLGMLLALITLTVVTNAATINVPADYSTIQAAVNAANGGDVINIAAGTYTENVTITGAKNGITIQGAGSTTILDGTGLANPRIAFKIQSDNVTIKDLKIQDYVYTGSEDVSYGSVTRGVGIFAEVATSLHTFTDVVITNCNYGIFVREGNSITIEDCNISNINATSNATTTLQGGIGITFEANGINMDNNIIRNNVINDADRFGIWYGRTTGSVGSDMTFIENNYILNIGTNYAGDGIGLSLNRIKNNDVILVADNHFGFDGTIYAPSDIHLFINSQTVNENLDITVIDNTFYATATSIEFYTTDFFGGDFLYDIWLNNGNTYTDVAYTYPGTAAALEANTNVVAENNGYRYIRNVVNNAVTDAEWYLTLGGGTYSKVYVLNGTYANTEVTVDANDIFVIAESQNAKLVSNGTNPIFTFASSKTAIPATTDWASVGNFTLQFPTVAGTYNGININAGSSDLLIQNNSFVSTGVGSAEYTGINIFDGADNVTFKNNTLSGNILNGVSIENDNSVNSIIECNTFNTSSLSSLAAISVNEINGGGNISNIIIRQNTITETGTGEFAIGIYLANTGGGTLSNITIGGENGSIKAGNIFSKVRNAIYVDQNDGNIVINYNAFGSSANVDFAIDANPLLANNLNAHFNYYEGVNNNFTTNIPIRNNGSTFPLIEWLPVYSSISTIAGDDQSTECGFQPNVNNLWVPVYTAQIENNTVDALGNEFFLTIKEALSDVNTSFNSTNGYVYLSNGTFNEGAGAITLFEPVSISIAPPQPANLATAGGVTITCTDLNPTFDIIVDGLGAGQEMKIKGLVITNSGVNFPLVTVAASIDNLIFEGNTFNLTDAAVSSNSAIYFADDNTSRDNHLFYNNTFNLRSSNYAIDYGTTNTNVSSNIYLLKNSFVFTPTNSLLDVAVRLGSVSGDLDVLGNSFLGGGLYLGKDASDYTDVMIGASGNHPTYNFPQGNTFSQVSEPYTYAIRVENNGGTATIANLGLFNVKQNNFEYVKYAVSFDAAIVDGDIDFNNIFVNENNFAYSEFDNVIDADIASAEVIDASNNYWNHAKGPEATAKAPTWHDDFPNSITSNSYGYPTVVNIGADLIDDENNVVFAPFWENEPTGNPGEYTGTSFAPITNNNSPNAGYYSSLIFAIEGTNSNGTIIMKDGTYTEQNTIENDGKNLYITTESQVYPSSVTIKNIGNDDGDLLEPLTFGNILFEITAGDVFIDYMNFDNLESDLSIGVANSGNGYVSIEYCLAQNMDDDGLAGWGDGFSNIGTGVLDVNLSYMTNNLYGASAVGGWLSVNSCEIYSNSNSGIYADNFDYVSAQNNNIYNCEYGFELYEHNIGYSAYIILNDIHNNNVGLVIGSALPAEDFSGIYLTNNSIYTNTNAGLVYVADNSTKVLNAENNYWGSSNGPAVDGINTTQYNAFNLGSQGDVISTDANSTVDYLPWRNYATSASASKTAGLRFAPIVLTNSANVAYSDGFYANFEDLNSAANANDNVFVYNGTYTQDWTLTKNNLDFIGKTATTYSQTWLYTPNSSIFTNTYSTSTKGAGTGAPILTTPNAILLSLDAGASNNTFTGFVFDLGVNATGQSVIQLIGANADGNSFTYNTFNNLAAIDIAFNLTDFAMNGITIQNNDFNGPLTGNGLWLNAYANADLFNINASYNNIDGCYAYLKNDAGNLTDFTFTYNEINNASIGINLYANDNAIGILQNITISNNEFNDASFDQSAFIIDAIGNSGSVDWASILFTNNLLNIIGIPVGYPVVGFTTAYIPSANFVATCNWWNDTNNEGPTNAFNPNGNGLTVSDNANYTPWLGVSTNLATFGFEPAVGACNKGERIYVNSTGVSTDRTIVFPSMYAALNHADVLNYTYPYIFIDNDYLTVNESVTVPELTANDYFFTAETASNTWTLTGNLTLGGTNDYTLNLRSDVVINGNLTIDVTLANGQIVLDDFDMTVGGTISNGDANRYVETDGDGYLIKKNPVSMTQYNFPVYNGGYFAPVYATLQETGFLGTEGALLKIRANNGTEPQSIKSEGELGYAVNGLWTVDFNKGTSTKTNTNASLIFRFISGLAPAGMEQASFDIANSYIAVWNPALTEPPVPATAKWNSYKSVSSQNGSDGTQVTGVNLIDNVTNNKFDYAIFSGLTSFALNDEPSQAKNIIWTNATDTKLKFRWSRNSTTAENWAIVAKEGSMTANSAITIAPWNIAGDNFVDGYGYTGETFYQNAGALSGGNYVYNSANFGTSNTHPGGSSNVKVIASGSYAPGQSLGEIEVEGLDQGKYYEFFVANYNGVGTGVDGTANFNQTFTTLNPRNRKTLPAVYIGLDFSAGFKTANTNNYTLKDAASNTASGDALTNYWYTGTICESVTGKTGATTLRFKNYGNNTTGWNIKYSENNFTVNTSTFFTDHTVSRNIPTTGNVNYYLVSATDGDGKVAKLYDNTKQVNIISHQTPNATIVSSVVGTTCETNNVTVTVTPVSMPYLTLNKWQYNIGAGWVDLLADGTVAGFGDFTGTNTLALTIDPVYNTTVLQVRAILNDLTVCDITTNTYTTGTISVPVYQLNPLTATQNPATITPVVCDGTGSVVFTTDITGLPVSATVQNWQYSTDNWATPVTINAGGDFAYNGTKTQLTVSNIVKATYDGMKFRVVYKNGDCAVVNTSDVTLTVLDQPVIATHPAVVGTACANSATNTITISATTVTDNWTNAKWYSSVDGYTTALTAGAGVTITKTGVTSTLSLTSIPLAWNGRTFKVVFENVGAITCATAMTNASAGITVYESPVIADVTDKLVCTGGTLPTITLNWTGTINNVTWWYGTSSTGPWTALPAGLDAATITTSGAQNHIIDIANINFAGVGVNWDGRYIRAFGTNGSCDDEEVFMINVYKSPSITSQPISWTSCAGDDNVQFTFASNFTDAPVETRSTISWEFYYGSTWHPIANLATVTGTTATVTGTTTNTLTMNNVDIYINGIGIRAKIGNSTCGNATTDGLATLAVNAVPVPPSVLGITNVKAGSFTTSWAEVLTATHYDLVVATDLTLTNVVYDELNIPTINPTISHTLPVNELAANKGQTLYVAVRSQNGCGEGPWNITTVTLLNPTATFAAANLNFGTQAINTCSNGKAVTITYDDLEEDLTIELPEDYKWSTSLLGVYAQALVPTNLGLTLGATGGTATIYVQFCPTDCGVLDGDALFNDQALGNTVITGANLEMIGTGIAVTPTAAASNLYFIDDNVNDFTLTFTEAGVGGGMKHIVVVSESATAWAPTADVNYGTSANLDITVADEVATNTWVVYDGTNTTVNVTGLTAGTVYYAYVYEYNTCDVFFKYGPVSNINQVYRLNIPTIASPVSSDTAFSMNVILHDRAGDPIANDIVDPITVTLTPNSGTLDVTSVDIDDASTQVGTFNQTWNETDGTLNATITASTLTNGVLPFTSNEFVVRAVEPTDPARVILWVGTPTCADFDIKWTNGDGSRRLITARKNALPENPTDYQTYTGNLTFGNGSQIGTSTYVMGIVTGTTNLLNNMVLSGSGTYYFRVVEFNGAASTLENYLLETATFNPRSRSMACKDMNDYAGIEVTDFNLTSAESNALVTFRTTYEQNIAGFEINRMDLANANPSFENIGTYTFNKELEAIGNSTTGKAYGFVDKSSKLMVGKTYVYQVIAVGFDGSRYDVAEGDITINNNDAVAGAAMSVSDVTVNNTTINFDVAVASNSNVTISVYDINGNLLTTIADGKQLSAGITNFSHNLNTVASGTYVLVIDAGNVAASQRFQIVK